MTQTILLVWIWWAWMSSLAGLLLWLWYKNIVWVSNIENDKIKELSAKWISTTIWHWIHKVNSWTFVIYSQAAEQSPEVQEAWKLFQNNHITNPPPLLYTQFLWEFSKYMKTIAITGTHGKSTTTWMVAYALKKLDQQFWVWINWAVLADRSSSYAYNDTHKQTLQSIIDHIFSRKWPFVEDKMKTLRFVIEACEYNQHFLHYDPDYAIITNCEIDHVSSYTDENEYFETFCSFIRRVKNKVFIPEKTDQWLEYCIQNLEEAHTQKIISVPTKQFSFHHLLWWHNNINASLAEALLREVTIDITIQETLKSYKWIWRRAE